MKTYTCTAYEYPELSEEAKEKVKEWYLSDPERAIDFRDMILVDLNDYLNPYEINVQFSLSSCQGDGVNIYGRIPVEAIKDAPNNEFFPWAGRVFWPTAYTEKEWRTLIHYSHVAHCIHIPTNPRYCFPMSSSIDLAEEWLESLQAEGYKNINVALIQRFDRDIKSWHRDLCRYYETMGYDYLYNVDDDELTEVCQSNEWFFDVDGNFLPGV